MGAEQRNWIEEKTVTVYVGMEKGGVILTLKMRSVPADLKYGIRETGISGDTRSCSTLCRRIWVDSGSGFCRMRFSSPMI